MDCTYLVGYWKLPNNIKHNVNHYYKNLPLTFDLLKDKQVIFYSNDDTIIEYVKTIAKTSTIIYRKRAVPFLPAFNITRHYVNSCKNQNNSELERRQPTQKGLSHYFRDFIGSGEETYRKLITIWLSKILLINEIITENIFNTKYFAWVDAGIGKLSCNYITKPINENRLNTNAGERWFKDMKVYNCAGFMIARKGIWLKIIPLYKQMLQAQKHSNYAHDEETLLRLIYKDHPQLFAQLK